MSSDVIYTCAAYDGCTMEVPYKMGWCHYCCLRFVYMSYSAPETPMKIDDDETMTPSPKLVYAADLGPQLEFAYNAGRASMAKERNAIALENSRLKVKLAQLEEAREREDDGGYVPVREAHLGGGLLAAAGAGVKGSGGRNPQACAECRAKKRSCDGDGRAACPACLHRGLECVYPEPQKRGPKPKLG